LGGLGGPESIDKAKRLEAMNLDEVLKLKFKGDKFRTGTIKTWIDGKGCGPKSGTVRKQLQSYVSGATMQKEIPDKIFRGFPVVTVGSRQILQETQDGGWD
jgi:hypothetical protein